MPRLLKLRRNQFDVEKSLPLRVVLVVILASAVFCLHSEAKYLASVPALMVVKEIDNTKE